MYTGIYIYIYWYIYKYIYINGFSLHHTDVVQSLVYIWSTPRSTVVMLVVSTFMYVYRMRVWRVSIRTPPARTAFPLLVCLCDVIIIRTGDSIILNDSDVTIWICWTRTTNREKIFHRRNNGRNIPHTAITAINTPVQSSTVI